MAELDRETVDLGRQRIAEIRAQLRAPRSSPTPPSEPSGTSATDEPPDVVISDEAAVMSALMAAGAERDRLEARVQELEAEVQRLRSAFAEVLATLSAAVKPAETRLRRRRDDS